jgi:dephospho-CoA kinase
VDKGKEAMTALKSSYIRLSKDARLYHLEKPIIGLTGGIATGQSTVSKILKDKGFEVIDADALVKSIYQTEEAKNFIRSEFSDAWEEEINFKTLRNIAFQDHRAKKKIENFIYTRLPEAFKKAADRVWGQHFYIYDVPLLFEKKLDEKVDYKVVVYAPRDVQRARILARDHSSPEVIENILDQQMDIEEKKGKADFVIDNSGTVEELAAGVEALLLRILD